MHTFGDLHIYENHREQVKEQLSREPNPLPKISFSQDFKSLDEFKPEFVQLTDYNAHPPIKAELTVAGGYNRALHETN